MCGTAYSWNGYFLQIMLMYCTINDIFGHKYLDKYLYLSVHGLEILLKLVHLVWFVVSLRRGRPCMVDRLQMIPFLFRHYLYIMTQKAHELHRFNCVCGFILFVCLFVCLFTRLLRAERFIGKSGVLKEKHQLSKIDVKSYFDQFATVFFPFFPLPPFNEAASCLSQCW